MRYLFLHKSAQNQSLLRLQLRPELSFSVASTSVVDNTWIAFTMSLECVILLSQEYLMGCGWRKMN